MMHNYMQSRFEEAFCPGLSISSNLGAQSFRNTNRLFEIEETDRDFDNRNYYDNLGSNNNDGQILLNRNNINLMFSPPNSESMNNQNNLSNSNKPLKEKVSNSKMKTAVPIKQQNRKLESKRSQDDQTSNLSSTRAPLSKNDGKLILVNISQEYKCFILNYKAIYCDL